MQRAWCPRMCTAYGNGVGSVNGLLLTSHYDIHHTIRNASAQYNPYKFSEGYNYDNGRV